MQHFISSKPKYKTSMAQDLLAWTLEREQTILCPTSVSLVFAFFFFYVSLHEMDIMSHLLTSQKIFHIECSICLKICISIYYMRSRRLDSHFRSYLYIGFPKMQLLYSVVSPPKTASINASVIFFYFFFQMVFQYRNIYIPV